MGPIAGPCATFRPSRSSGNCSTAGVIRMRWDVKGTNARRKCERGSVLVHGRQGTRINGDQGDKNNGKKGKSENGPRPRRIGTTLPPSTYPRVC